MDEDEPAAEATSRASAAHGLARARRIGGPLSSSAGSPPAGRRDHDGPRESLPGPAEDSRARREHACSQGPATTSRAGRNLPVAIAVGLGLGGIVVLSLFLYRPSFAFIVGAASAYATFELARAMASSGGRPALLPVLVGGSATLFAAWERGPQGLVAGVLLTACGVLIWRLADGARGYLRDAGASLFVLCYVPTLAGFAVLSAHADDGAARILAFVATVVCSDTGGYASGVLFGKHPLAPIVSKAKTWEGFAGSALLCSVAGVLLLTLTFHEDWWKGLLFGLAIVVTATLGDLGESLVKRDLGVKDMGHLLPGHGGLMDRLDSLLPCAAVAYLLLSGFAPVG